MSSDSKKPWVPPPAKTSKAKASCQIQSNLVLCESDDSEKGSYTQHEKGKASYLKITRKNLESLCELCQDLQLLGQHYQLLMSSSEFLRNFRLVDLEAGEQQVALGMISEVVQNIEEFSSSFRAYEMNVSDLDACLKEDVKELQKSLGACRLSKDLTILKVLKAYDSTTSIYQFILNAQKNDNGSSVVKEHDFLWQKLEEFQNHFMSRGSQLVNVERELSLSKVRQKSLEDQITHLHSVLSQKNVEIERLVLLLEEQTVPQKGFSSNEKLIEIIEEIQNKAEAEKEALKKALKVQTSRAEEFQNKISDLNDKINEQERAYYQLAVERDQWKAELTVSKNQCIELENRRLSIQMKNSALESQLEEFKQSKREVDSPKDEVDKINNLLELSKKENESLKAAAHVSEEMYSSVQKELKELEMNYKRLEESNKILVENSKKLDTFNCEKMKEEVSETRGTLQEIEKSLIIMQRKCEKEISEKEKLQSRLDSLESKLLEDQKRREGTENVLKGQTVCWKCEASCQLENKNRNIFEEADLVRLQDAINSKDEKIKFLEKCQTEAEKRCSSKVRELQSNLDRISMNYESLQKYVKLLKSSYVNVFGSS